MLELPAVVPRSTVDVDIALPTSDGPGERWLTVRFQAAVATPWYAGGDEVCWAQVQIDPAPPRGLAAGIAAPQVNDDGLLLDDRFTLAPRLSLWRAPTDNDHWGGVAELWDDWGVATLVRRCDEVTHTGDGVEVAATYTTGAGIEVTSRTTYLMAEDGTLLVREVVEVPAPLTDLPRVGTTFETQPGLDRLTWFGRGPHESYPDRCVGAAVGRWSADVDDLHVPYIRPQESGGRADVRCFELHSADGSGLRVSLDRPRQVSVSRYRPADLAAASHHPELVALPETVVHLDAAHRGLGTASCGPDTLPRYLVRERTYTWGWSLSDLHPASR